MLIVEDEILPAMALQAELEDAGYHIMDLTGRHQEALAAARDCKPDLALVNIQLEGRDDGIELAHDLKAMGIPVVFISGQSSRAKAAQTVAIVSLAKPYSTVDMVKAVDYLLARLRGDETLVPPIHLEVFEPIVRGALPDAA
jgi:DNA-binding response OmpR family regulator